MSIASLLGTYRWICQWDDMVGSVWYPTKEYDTGFVTFSVKPDAQPTAENIGGSLRVWNQKACFTSLIQPKYADNSWNIERLMWAELSEEEKKNVSVQEEECDHGFSVLDVQDDNGNPFILFYVNGGYSGCCQMFASFLGKKEKEGDTDVRGAEKLSMAERERLNWDKSEEEVERDRPNSDEEKPRGEEDGSEGSTDGEDADGTGQEVNVAGVTAAKRKAEEAVDGPERKLTSRKV